MTETKIREKRHKSVGRRAEDLEIRNENLLNKISNVNIIHMIEELEETISNL